VPQGAYVVSRDPQETAGILFALAGVGEPAEDQRELQVRVEQTLGVLRQLLPQRGPRFEEFLLRLLSLSQAGLVGPNAAPLAAKAALAMLRDEVVGQYAPEVKNRYMRRLGMTALGVAAPACLLGVLLALVRVHDGVLGAVVWGWVGCAGGVWLSFGMRKKEFGFDDLVRPEEDRMEPVIRLLFACLLTAMFMVLLALGAIEVRVGGLSSSGLLTNSWLAWVVGGLCGFSELTLPQKVANQAAAWLAAK